MADPEARPARGPLDPRVLGLSPALRTHLAVSAALAGVVAAAVLAQAEAVARLLPRLVHGDKSATAPLVATLAAVGLVRAAAAAATERSATAAVVATRTSVRTRVLDHLGVVRLRDRDQLGPARVVGLTTTAIDSLEPWVRAYLPGLTLAAVVPLAAGLRILGADLLSAVVLAVVVPLVPVFMVLIGKATEDRAASRWDALQRLSARFLDTLAGLPTLRLFGRADAQVDRVREVTDRYRRTTMGTLRVAFLSALVLELLSSLSVALVAVSLGIRLTEGHLTLSTALVVLLLAPECLLPIRRVSAAFHAAVAGVDAAEDVGAALELPARPEGDRTAPTDGVLAVRAAAVTDPDRGVRLLPVDVEARPGELLTVEGPSGAGKSTLLDVLRGALEPDGPPATLGGVPVSELARTARTGALAWVPQRPAGLDVDVARSVALGHPIGADTDRAVLEALDEVGLGELADRSPAELSGGERRRVALARALVGARLGRTRVVLLDEPTAQLDPASAALVVAAIVRTADEGAAVVVATHDLALTAVAHRRVEVAVARPPVDEASTTPHHLAPVRVDAPPVPDPVSGWAPPPDLPGGRPAPGALRWLLGIARPRRARFLGALALGVAADACTVGLAGTAAWLIVRAAERPSFADLAVAAVAVRAFGVGKGVVRYAERLASHDAALRLLADLRATVVGRLARLAPTGLPPEGRGDLLSRLVDDVDRLQDLFLRVLGPVAAALAVCVGAVVVSTVLDPPSGVALATAVAIVGIALPALAFATARARGVESGEARGDLAGATLDLAEHVEELVACGAEPAWRARVEEAAARVDELDRRQGRPSALVAAVAAAAPALGTAAVVALAGAAGPGLSGPALGVVVLLPLAVLELVAPLAAAGDALARVEASAARVRGLLERSDPMVEPPSPAPRPGAADLVLHDAAVGWPGGPVLVEGIDLALAEGRRAVVTGPSGSGKSTVAALLVAFLPPAAGRYEVGSVASGDLGSDRVRELVTWCPQDPWFADSTVADNLRVARPDADDDELWAALAVAHLDSWARRLPRGLDTRLERDARAMSGGERQRLALARALLGGQRAVVLDEPTAHLDVDTADAVLGDLLTAVADRAVVVIAHDGAASVEGIRCHLEPTADGPARWTVEGG
ncbi:MAG: thiol reductant ABC exporter subunit CydD [Actinobacteria bacterium]|nr:thiol reductant ABC exporter subunit CydD [Actinomycetota bacterium]